MLLCATTDLKVKPPASDQNADSGAAGLHGATGRARYRTASSVCRGIDKSTGR